MKTIACEALLPSASTELALTPADDLESLSLVSVLITRKLASGHLLIGAALVDRTYLCVKDGFVSEPMMAREVEPLVDRMGSAYGGMVPCAPLVAQSIVFHAIDDARARLRTASRLRQRSSARGLARS